MQIYLLFYPNCERQEEGGLVLVKELQKYIFKYFGKFYSLYIFLESIYLLHKHEQHLENETKKTFFLAWNGIFNSNDSLIFFLILFFFSTLEKKKNCTLKMFIDLNPGFLFVYFENGLLYDRVKKLSSRTLVHCIRFLCT